MSTRKFRLQNLAKRCGEGELSTFSASHKFEGYMRTGADGRPVYRTLLMPNTCFASFTETGLTDAEQETLWRRFSGNDGVRLTFNVEASNTDYRRMRYQPERCQPIKVLEELAVELMVRHRKLFMLSGISRVCAFLSAPSRVRRGEGMQDSLQVLGWHWSATHRKWPGSVSGTSLEHNERGRVQAGRDRCLQQGSAHHA